MSMLARVALAVAVAALSGCVTIGSLQPAETLGEGKVQVAIEPGVWGGVVAQGGGSVVGPSGNVAVRYGVSDRVDIGGRAGTAGLELGFKYLFTDPTLETGPVIASLAPTLGGAYFGINGQGAGNFWLNTPVLVGVRVGDHELVIGPRLLTAVTFLKDGSQNFVGVTVAPGTSLGFSFHIKKLRILPEIAVVVPVLGGGAVAGDSGVGVGFGGVLYQGQVGFLIGGR